MLVCCSCFHIWMWSSQLAEPEPGPWAPSDPWSLLGVSFPATCRVWEGCCGCMAVPHRPVASPLLWERLQVLPAGLTAGLCLVNTCTSLCKPSPMLWSLPGSHRKHLIATICWVANNTKQKVWGVADPDHHQMTLIPFPWMCIWLIFQHLLLCTKCVMHTAVVKVNSNGHLASQMLWVGSSRDSLGGREHLKIQASLWRCAWEIMVINSIIANSSLRQLGW